MRIAHVTTDEVDQELAVQAASPIGATMTPLGPEEDMSTHFLFDAVLYDLDRVPPDRREAILDGIRSETTNRPMAVYGYCLTEEAAQKTSFPRRRRGGATSCRDIMPRPWRMRCVKTSAPSHQMTR